MKLTYFNTPPPGSAADGCLNYTVVQATSDLCRANFFKTYFSHVIIYIYIIFKFRSEFKY
jgi:hypothetical protein